MENQAALAVVEIVVSHFIFLTAPLAPDIKFKMENLFFF